MLAALLLALLTLLACAGPVATSKAGPSVVVIVTDTTRADLGGAEWPAWAKGGRRYTRAYSAAPYTTSSTVTLATGRYPQGQERIPPTTGNGRCWRLGRSTPSPATWPKDDAWPDLVLTDQPVVARLAGVEAQDYDNPGSDALVQAGIDALDDGHRGIYWHGMGGHEPLAGTTEGWSVTTPDSLVARLGWCGALRPDLAGWARWQYRAAVEQSLSGVGRLVLASLRAGAVVIWTSDHGEALGEGGRWSHGRSLDDEQVRVPIVVLGPGVVPGVDDRITPATCVGQTARAVLDGYLPAGACDLRTGEGLDGIKVVTGMLLPSGVWDERVILNPVVAGEEADVGLKE